MQTQRRTGVWRVGFGLLGALILASPGAGADSASGGSDQVCSSAQSQDQQHSSLENFRAQVRGRAALRRRSEGSEDGIVVLNNSGYNYTTRYEWNPEHAPQLQGADQDR